MHKSTERINRNFVTKNLFDSKLSGNFRVGPHCDPEDDETESAACASGS